MSKRNPSTADDEFLAKARERFKAARDYWDPIYVDCKDNLEFYSGDQWPEGIQSIREQDTKNPRPCLTINRLPQFHNQIVNDYRQSSLGMKAAPQETHDLAVAEIYSGLFKQIEKQSFAQTCYIKGLSDAAIHGIGYGRVITDYADDSSFDQEIFIKRVTNPFSHFPDPDATEFFLEDSDFWIVIDRVPESDYEEGGQYEDFDPTDFVGSDELQGNWREEDYIITAEYFYYETNKRTLLKVEDEDGNEETVWKDELPKGDKREILKERDIDVRELFWCKIDGYNILEKKRKWGTNRIPIAPIWGNELWVAEKRVISGFVKGARDSQRMYNYWQSAKTEMIALAPKAPYIAAEGQLEGQREQEWQDATSTPKAVLYYKPVSVDGHLVGAPQRQTYEAPVQGIIQASLQSSDDMKATIGIYDASLGAKGNEVSGRAINARKAQGATATYNFVDNLAMFISYLGIIVAELIPVVYDTARQIRIIGEDDKPRNVRVNGDGEPDIVNIKYDLVLDSAPSYATQRQESTDVFMELARQYPKVFDVAGDIIIQGLDVTNAQKIADRLKRTLPPQVVGEEADPETKLAAASTMIEQLKQAMQAATDKIAELEQSNAMAEAKLIDKSGELKIRQQEVNVKKQEAQAKLIQAGAAAASSKENANAVPLVQAALEAIQELAGHLTGVMDMVEALAGGNAANDDNAPVDQGTAPVA